MGREAMLSVSFAPKSALIRVYPRKFAVPDQYHQCEPVARMDLLPYKAARPNNRRHLHVVVFIPFLAAGILRLAMAHQVSPLGERGFIPPPDHRNYIL